MQVALEFTGITLKSSDTNFEGFCAAVYKHHEQGGVCGQQFVLRNTKNEAIATPTVNCVQNGVRHPELYAVLSLCATPCMQDKSNVCCFVPAEVAWMFPCCRAQSCCPDQVSSDGGTHVGSRRRALGQRSTYAPPVARVQPAVSVSVSVEETSSSKTTYSSTMQCLASPTAVCLKTHKLTLMIKVAGAGRRLSSGVWTIKGDGTPRHMQASGTACKNGGTPVTCDDGIKNQNEAMTDCGGPCGTSQCAAAAAQAVRPLDKDKLPPVAHAGTFDVRLPIGIRKASHGWSASVGTTVVRESQTLTIECTASTLCSWPARVEMSGLAIGPRKALSKVSLRRGSMQGSFPPSFPRRNLPMIQLVFGSSGACG